MNKALILFLIFFQPPTLNAKEIKAVEAGLLAKSFKEFSAEVKNAGFPPAGLCAGNEYNHVTGAKEKVGSIYSKAIKKDLKLSVLTPTMAQSAFNIAKNDDLNDFTYPLDGCFARAHRTSYLLESHGIISGKAFIEGELYLETNLENFPEIGWEYHTATFILVEEKNKIIPYVIDPVLFDKAVSYNEWRAAITKSKKTKIQEESLTSRFTYNRMDKSVDFRDWEPDELEESLMHIRNGRRMSEMLEIELTKDWYN